MEKLEFLKTKQFFKYYLLLTVVTLVLTLFFNVLGPTGVLAVQKVAGFLTVVAVPLLVILVLLIFSRANRNDEMGRKIIRINYLTIIIMCLCFSFLVLAGLMSSFYFNPASTPLLGQSLAIYSFVICITFGICLSLVCYLTLPIESAWLFQS
jgi:hypothetical protein